ncbi:MAG: sensor histidine kinase [Acidobacteria bacterium]|nr:sensor histidine kinase [Acidobacteriota bacterium]
MKKRTWPVVLLGLCCLLVLIAWPGWAMLQRTQRLFAETAGIQQRFAERQGKIQAVNERIQNSSIVIRDYLLDSAPAAGPRYRKELVANREEVGRLFEGLRQTLPASGVGPLQRLEEQYRLHFDMVMPVFAWTAAEKQRQATYFLRMQQRPRREGLLAISREVAGLSEAVHQRQLQALGEEQETFRAELRTMVGLALGIGMVISVGAVWRIRQLEGARLQYEQQLRELSARVMRAQEEERRSLSRELHDEVGQMLTGLRMELGALDRFRKDEAQFRTHHGEAKELTEQTMRMVRDLAVGLRPSLLDDLGLGPALQAQVRDFNRRWGGMATLEISGATAELDELQRTCRYRLVQEGLTNCARHARAKVVRIGLVAEGKGIVLTLTDDGVGFDATGRRGFGLIGMEERVRELGGRLVVDSAPGEGTC